mmetsp:Transcript_5195/g.12398  ORF Transcript_5195/g.12398 Transcript_5195/m.12398 type:complete len:218 (+) Transcript_5195:2589-3242(+)
MVFSCNDNTSSLAALPTFCGIVPSKELLSRRMLFMFGKANRRLGMAPVSWLFEKSTDSSAKNLEKESRMVPANWFLPRETSTRFVRRPNSSGMEPENRLSSKCSSCSARKFPIKFEIVPEKLQPEMLILLIALSCQSSPGNVPSRSLRKTDKLESFKRPTSVGSVPVKSLKPRKSWADGNGQSVSSSKDNYETSKHSHFSTTYLDFPSFQWTKGLSQ